MGLASKLAAAQGPGGYPPSGGPPSQGGYPPALQPGQKPGSYPGQGQYQPYPGANQTYPGQPAPQPPYPASSSQPQSQPVYPPAPQFNQQAPYGQGQPYITQPPNYSRPPPPPPPGQYGGYQQPSYGQPTQYNANQTSYPTSMAPGYGQPSQYPSQQQGGYPPQGGQQYGAPPPPQGGPQQVAAYRRILQSCIQEKGLQNMYPPNDPRLDAYANRAMSQVEQLCQKWHVPREVGQDIVKLALYDIVLYIDNSGSMEFEEGGERINDLRLILSRVAYAASLFDDDGIQVRFMNVHPENPPQQMLDGIRSEQQASQLVSPNGVKWRGLTPLGTQLRQQVVDPLLIQKARSGQLRKPVLIVTVTDGQPAGEDPDTLANTIRYAASELARMPQYGQGAVAFQFAQVGNDQAARRFLGKLDETPDFGSLVDCTSNFENEQEEMSKANPPVDLTPDLWLIKLLLGSIDSSYDTQDEKSSARPPGQGYSAPPPGQYGAPPPGQYGGPGGAGGYGQQPGGYPPPQQGYGQPQQGYGRPPPQQGGYPPQQGGYPPQQGGYPPQQGGHPPQQGGYPPQQGGYGGQQGGYGAPPPPPRY